MEILVRQDYSPEQIKRAEIARDEYRKNRYTSGSAHLDDLIALGKAIILCDSHARKFKPRAAHYEHHPAPNMRRVVGNCDVCNVPGLAMLYVCAQDAIEHRRNWERTKRALEYATIVTS